MRFFICLYCEYLQCILYLFVLRVFAVRFFICLHCEYLLCVSLFVYVVSICSAFVYLFAL